MTPVVPRRPCIWSQQFSFLYSPRSPLLLYLVSVGTLGRVVRKCLQQGSVVEIWARRSTTLSS